MARFSFFLRYYFNRMRFVPSEHHSIFIVDRPCPPVSEVKRGSFSSRRGFILAAAACAVGLGNLWRFPYLTSHYGGGIFVLVYVIIAMTFGFSLMLTEIAIGRKTGKTCIQAFGDLCHRHRWIGYLSATVPFLLASVYFVIGSWVTKWFANCATGQLHSMVDYGGNYWWDFISGGIEGFVGPVVFFLIFSAVCIIFVVRGVEKGIEKVNLLLMPMLIVLMIGVTVYSLVTIEGIWDGVVYYLAPDFNKLTMGTLLGAVSQVFFSMSLSSGAMMAYGSYMRKEDSIEESVKGISLIDTGVAIIAGLMIVPAAYTFGFEDSQGMGLLFTVMPTVFANMVSGNVISTLFYFFVLIAAATSAVAMFEALVAQIIDRTNIQRKKAIIATIAFLIPAGLLVIFGFGPLMTNLYPFDQGVGLLGIVDTVSNSILMPLIAIATCIFVGYVIGTDAITEEVESFGNPFKRKWIYIRMIKYVCPLLLGVMLVLGLLDQMNIFSLY